MPTKAELTQMWRRPVERQYNIAISKMLEAIRDTEGDITICFSGGKDSSLLLDMYCEIIQSTEYRDKPIKVAFADTTNETRAIYDYVSFFIPYIEQKYNVKIKQIYVMDASKRTTRANAFCTGIGKKTISLDDNLVNNYSTDKIVAVFAHEFGHAKYKHTLKSIWFAFLRIIILILALGVVLNIPAICEAFGFKEVNYYFAFMILTMISWPVSRVFDLISNKISRTFEYQADAFATKEGYGESLIGALKQLSRDALTNLNPHPFVVALEHSHPTLSDRISAITKNQNSAEK